MMFVDCFRALGSVSTVYLSGGATKSPFVCQLLCDALGIPVRRQTAKELGALGVAKMLALALGHAASFDEMIGDSYVNYTPDRARHVQYEQLYRSFIATRDSVAPHWGKTS